MCPKLLVRDLHPIRHAFAFEDPRHTHAFHRERIRTLPLQAEIVARGKHNKWRMLFRVERNAIGLNVCVYRISRRRTALADEYMCAISPTRRIHAA